MSSINLNNALNLNQSQKLVMTTQLKQSLTILNMNKIELEEEIKREVEINPILEAEKKNEIDWESYIKNIEKSRVLDRNEINYNSDKDVDFENMIKDYSNIYDELKFQINLYNLKENEKKICEYIINSLDEDGYLRSSDIDIVEELNISKKQFKKCLDIIQQLEPSGVGARSLSECIIIQMNNKRIYNDTLERIVREDLNLIANNKYKDISKKYNITLQKCIELVNLIKQFDPKPGRFCSVEKSIYIQPDVVVEKIDDEFVVYINEKDEYSLRINNYYKEILKNNKSDDNAKEFIKEKLNSATGLIKNVQSRKSTILRISKEIVKTQDEFFRKGSKYIKPLKMKELADELQCHESTISRGVNGKYMLTPYGMFELKYFFSTSISTDDNNNTSSTSLKKIIQEKIKNEDKKKPLSDEKIAKDLKKEGINLARRTVAKYREELKIPSSSRRKQY